MAKNYSETVNTARDYYNSEDADTFYATIWGGEDIHVGLYDEDNITIPDASHKTVARMADRLQNINSDSYVLDLGAGYGGSARYLAKKYGCKVVALNLSEVENQRDRELNKKHGLDHLIEVIDGDFENIPYSDATFDVVWSQDSFLHSGNRRKVLEEVVRVLKKDGEFIFTDPMQSDDCPEGVLKPILERIHLDTLGSPGFYRETAKELGMQEVEFDDLTPQLANHYGRVLEETEKKEDKLKGAVSEQYIERMKKGLKHWVAGGRSGHMAWGILHFKKA